MDYKFKFLFYICACLLQLKAISQTTYNIDSELDSNEKVLTISQTISFKNTSTSKLDKLYLNDWANSYEGTESQLVNHLANQFNRSFYFSAKNKLGYTEIENINDENKSLRWSRLENQLDIVEVKLIEAINPGDIIDISIKYKVKLPDDKFTGYGINSNNKIFFRDFFISVSPFKKGNWILQSNLGLRDNSNPPSNYFINWKYPKNYNLVTNLTNVSTKNQSGNLVLSQFEAAELSSPEFIFDEKNDFEKIVFDDGFVIVTDILPKKNGKVELEKSLQKIYSFTKTILGPLKNYKLLVLRKDYAKNPLVGISEAFSFLKPFSEEFIFETKFIKAFLASYLHELLEINKRKDHWIPGGIQTYTMMKYVEKFYPETKFLGALKDFKILGIPLFKGYSAPKIGFNESFSFIYEFGEHANNQQSDTLGREKLTKSNELYTSPYHVGSGLFYLDQFLGKRILEESLYEYTLSRGEQTLKTILENKSNKNLNWFFNDYLSDREAFDLHIKNTTKNKTTTSITISEKNKRELPFKLDFIKNDSILKEHWYFHSGNDSIFKFKNGEYDFVAINSNRYLPEKNRKNNWKYLRSSHGIKPLKLTFYGDSENLKRNQLFYHPISDFNVYDGFTAGMRIYNTRVKNQPFELDVHPQYSFKEDDYVGFFRTRYRFINHKSKNYLNQAFITGKSYHYNTNLRYTSIQPSFSMYFRPLDLRSNKRQLFNVSWYNVFRERDPEIEVNPDYSVLSFLHRYNNSDAVNVFSTTSNLEVSGKFGKIHFTSQYRKLFPSGRQFSIRFFAGKFIWHNTLETQFFDFNLNRSPDYLFRYDYLGRSDETGIWSQQFVPAEGGFKSFFDESSSNNYMISINASIGIWKWIELYGDVGTLKNQGRNSVSYFDSGIKFNLVQDYFELFFPLYSSNGFEPTQDFYSTKIRFLFYPRLSTLSSLFTRKWF